MTATRIAVNGLGRMGRLALRAGWDRADLEFVHVNELHGDAATAAHLLCFDSVHGRWACEASGDGDALTVDGQSISYGGAAAPCLGTNTEPTSCSSAPATFARPIPSRRTSTAECAR